MFSYLRSIIDVFDDVERYWVPRFLRHGECQQYRKLIFIWRTIFCIWEFAAHTFKNHNIVNSTMTLLSFKPFKIILLDHRKNVVLNCRNFTFHFFGESALSSITYTFKSSCQHEFGSWCHSFLERVFILHGTVIHVQDMMIRDSAFLSYVGHTLWPKSVRYATSQINTAHMVWKAVVFAEQNRTNQK